MEPVQPFSALNAFVGDASVVIQPVATGGEAVETLSVDLRSGSVQQLSSAPQRSSPIPVVAVLGVSRLFKGHAVVVVTSAKVVATVLGADIYQATSTKIITSEEARMARENRGIMKLLSDGIDPEGSGRALYFSYCYDVTLSAQRTAVIAQDPSPAMQTAAARAEKDFFWNFALARPLIEAEAHRFVMPAILGFVRQVPGLKFNSVDGKDSKQASLTLIARRSVQRAGTRHWRRGADADGNVANFVETEQLLQLEPEAGSDVPTLASFVQVRGSIPLMWTEMPNIKYKPTRLIAPPEQQTQVFTKHFANLVEQYKDVLAINLVNQHGGEGKLADAFQAQVDAYHKQGGKGLHYVPFDFHKECGTKRYHRLSILWDQISDDFSRHGFFMHGSRGTLSKQKGVIRTNCIDCLDRTNVLQGILARRSLDNVLQKLGLLAAGSSLPDAYPVVEQEFKVLWADHGDAVSTQYAGTGAMKSMFTRTGKRTIGGIVDDGYKAVARYYLNNFRDGKKQDAVDLVTGTYVPQPGGALPPRKQRSPLLPVIFAVLFVVMGMRNAGHMLSHQPQQVKDDEAVATRQAINLHDIMATVVVPLLTGLGILYMTVQNGKYLVNKPQLCYHLAATVAKPSKK